SSLYTIPKLANNGSNWITYKERALTVIHAQGLMQYLEDITKPTQYSKDTAGDFIKPDGSKASKKEVEELEEKIDEYLQKDSLTQQHIFSTILDRLLLQVQKLDLALKIWEEIRVLYEGKTELMQIDLR
ncbi:hypothetical protein BDR06DRAFT_861493, partial [Suillus hirtellus]